MRGRYRIYGDLESRQTIALSSVLMVKGLAAERVDEAPSLSFALAARSGEERGPYLRTPDGFVLGDLHAILEWIERSHPEPSLIPRSPVRRACARLVEDWVEFWLPLFARRSWQTLEGVGVHLASSGTLLGGPPTRADWLLAAWLESEVVLHAHVRQRLERTAPHLLDYAGTLFELPTASENDDAISIGLLTILEEVGREYHAYLALNQHALKDRESRVVMDFGLGKWAFPVRRECEERRIAAAEEVEALLPHERHAIRYVLEPVGCWHALTLPDLLDDLDPSDPRSL